jgi:hypothetical protein
MDKDREYLIDWLVTFGTDWVPWRKFREWDREMNDEQYPIYQLRGKKYLEIDHAPYEYKLTDAGLALIKQGE